MRFKPPPPNSSIGWRVEFRPMEIQLTDFENAAFVVFVVLLTRAILSFKLNLYIPITKVVNHNSFFLLAFHISLHLHPSLCLVSLSPSSPPPFPFPPLPPFPPLIHLSLLLHSSLPPCHLPPLPYWSYPSFFPLLLHTTHSFISSTFGFPPLPPLVCLSSSFTPLFLLSPPPLSLFLPSLTSYHPPLLHLLHLLVSLLSTH